MIQTSLLTIMCRMPGRLMPTTAASESSREVSSSQPKVEFLSLAQVVSVVGAKAAESARRATLSRPPILNEEFLRLDDLNA